MMEDLIKRYDKLYDDMASSKEVKKMMAFGAAEKRIFRMVAEKHPDLADKWIGMIESGMWNNYLTEEEAKKIASGLINQDGSPGPHWSMDTFFGVVPRLGGIIEDDPYYNKYALWLVANAHYSDFATSTAMDMGYRSAREAPEDKMAQSMYRKAVESLKDVDRAHYVHDYYHV